MLSRLPHQLPQPPVPDEDGGLSGELARSCQSQGPLNCSAPSARFNYRGGSSPLLSLDQMVNSRHFLQLLD